MTLKKSHIITSIKAAYEIVHIFSRVFKNKLSIINANLIMKRKIMSMRWIKSDQWANSNTVLSQSEMTYPPFHHQ